MNRLSCLQLTLAILAALVGGCASTASSVPGSETVTAERIYETVAAQHRTITTMEGSGSISVQTPDMAQSGTFELLLKKPDSLLLKFEGPFGIDVGAALVSRQEFQFYDVFQNRLIVGQTTPANLERVFRMAVSFDDLLALVAGGTFMSMDDPAHSKIERTEASYRMTFAGDPFSRQYVIDPVSLLITNIVLLRSNGTVIVEQRFGDFRRVDGVLVPFDLKVIQRAERRMVAVRYSEVSLNRPSPQLRFAVPENARRIQLQ